MIIDQIEMILTTGETNLARGLRRACTDWPMFVPRLIGGATADVSAGR
jgi:hypothetical protein